MQEILKRKQSEIILCALNSVLPNAVYISRRKNELFVFSDEEIGLFHKAINMAFSNDLPLMIAFGANVGMVRTSEDELKELKEDFKAAIKAIRDNPEAMEIFSLLAELSNEHCHYDEYWEGIMSELTFMDKESLKEKTDKIREITNIFPNLAQETLIQGIMKYYATK